MLGTVVQINPGPVVTTFEFKPEAGIKYSRITTLSEDLCLGLQAESILIERIPGKPTVGIEVPNTKRELIACARCWSRDEFQNSPSHLTIPLGKDINGRIKVAALEIMPHLLIAGSTGSGKSVMINSMIMSILYKSTPDEVRMIMVDPKRVELGIYEGIPHLLTPVITDPQEGHQRAAQRGARDGAAAAPAGRVRRAQHRPVQQEGPQAAGRAAQPVRRRRGRRRKTCEPLPYILILIDELADLMMLEGANVEESVTRLAQMARAVGMHLVLATQRPSVDVITGLIKANFPARISFRVATRVDSRTILDVMGAEHLLGKGDMLFLPPGLVAPDARARRVRDGDRDQARGRFLEGSRPQPEYDQTLPDRAARRRRAKPTPRSSTSEQDPHVRGRRARGAARWARPPPPRCSAACGWATAAPRAFST